MLAEVLRERIRAERQSRGWTQADLAAHLDVSQTAVSYWETGARDPGLDDVDHIARAFGIDSVRLLLSVETAELHRALDLLRDAHHTPYADEEHQGSNCADIIVGLLAENYRLKGGAAAYRAAPIAEDAVVDGDNRPVVAHVDRGGRYYACWIAGGETFAARCNCGWSGPERASQQAAALDLPSHEVH